jgi:protein disulfide-isomerase
MELFNALLCLVRSQRTLGKFTFARVIDQFKIHLTVKALYLFFFLSILALQACSQSPSNTPASTGTKSATGTPAPTPTQNPAQPKAQVYKSTKEGWLVDLDEAYTKSTKEGKPILANFTGSDWCGWCKRLDADVFSKPEFQTWAEENVVLLELDFPRRFQIPQKNQSQNHAMKNALGVTGFPTIWVVNLTKDKASGQYQIQGLGKTGYTPKVETFISTVDQYIN